jgi:hypothetical protein
MAQEGYSIVSPSQSYGIFSFLITNPFYPSVIVEESGDTYKLEFNQAYYFDYADLETLKTPQKITNISHTLKESGNEKFYVKVKIKNDSGKVESAEIVKEKNPQNQGKQNLPLKTEFDPKGDTEDIAFHILLAEFEGPHIKELYLRDNLHFNYRKFEQLGKESDGVFPIIPEGDEPEKANGKIKFHAIARKNVADNDLEIELKDGILEFYVKGDGSSS